MDWRRAAQLPALVAGADFVLASPSAKFYAAFAGIGIVSDSGGGFFLPRRMGSRRAAQFYMLQQETLTAEEAAVTGLINRVVKAEALHAEGLGHCAQTGTQGPTRAFGEAKNLLLSSPTESLEGQLENEARAMARVTAPRTPGMRCAPYSPSRSRPSRAASAAVRPIRCTGLFPAVATTTNSPSGTSRAASRATKLTPQYQARDKSGVLDHVRFFARWGSLA